MRVSKFRFWFICLVGLFFVPLYVLGQSKATKNLEIYPEVGKPMPQFTLKNIEYHPRKQATLKDFNGKWLILDFWNKYCGACIASFPKMSKIQEKFQNKLQVVMVGYNGSAWSHSPDDKAIKQMYARYKEKLDLKMPSAFDSALFDRFSIRTNPYIIVIDTNRIVRAITTGISETDIEDLFQGKSPYLRKAYRSNQEEQVNTYDFKRPFLSYGNGGEDSAFAFRSLLARWKEGMSKFVLMDLAHPVQPGRFEVLKVGLSTLYKYAYIGKYSIPYGDSLYGIFWNSPLIEAKDTSSFIADFLKGENLYCYSLIVPPEKSSERFLMEAMQRDLKTYFEYDAQIEKKQMPYWKLISTGDAKIRLKSRSDTSYIKELIPKANFIAKNIPVEKLLLRIAAFQPGDIPFIDETGIVDNIDISIQAVMTDLNDVRSALQKNGLDLIKSEREMKVLIIRDSKENE